MSAVFLGRVAPGARSRELSPRTPELVAVKVVLPTTAATLASIGLEARDFVKKEVLALSKVMERSPSTPHVIGFYGSGELDVALRGAVVRLPWMAIELVDPAGEGASLEDRVLVSGGLHPDRARRLIRGVCDGVSVLHAEGIVHRDIKPENVLVAGDVANEVPKLSDCGIARLSGVHVVTLAAASAEYAAPEQLASVHGEANPTIGPWTDVHALAAVVWFVLAGGSWWEATEALGDRTGWTRGRRASLANAPALHAALRADGDLLGRLDAVLARGASARIGGAALEAGRGSRAHAIYERRLPLFVPSEPRYESVAELADALAPLMDRLVGIATRGTLPSATARRRPTRPIAPLRVDATRAFLRPDARISLALVQRDGRILARSGRRLFYVIDGRPTPVQVPPEHEATLVGAPAVRPLPRGGFGIVGPDGVLAFSQGKATMHAMPAGAGAPAAWYADRHALVLVTEERDGSDGPEIWSTTDPSSWSDPMPVDAMNGTAVAVVRAHGGVVIVGRARRADRWRALYLAGDGRTKVFSPAPGHVGALTRVVAVPARDSYAAGPLGVVRLGPRDHVSATEEVDVAEDPVAMAVDPAGVPWLLLPHALLRRHDEDSGPRWRVYLERPVADPPFVAFEATRSAIRIIDAASAVVDVVPVDSDGWSADDATAF